jgi:hypothetical protein
MAPFVLAARPSLKAYAVASAQGVEREAPSGFRRVFQERIGSTSSCLCGARRFLRACPSWQPGGRECGASPGNRLGERVDDPSAAREPAGHSITTICPGVEVGRTESTFGMSGAVSASRFERARRMMTT